MQLISKFPAFSYRPFPFIGFLVSWEALQLVDVKYSKTRLYGTVCIQRKGRIGIQILVQKHWKSLVLKKLSNLHHYSNLPVCPPLLMSCVSKTSVFHLHHIKSSRCLINEPPQLGCPMMQGLPSKIFWGPNIYVLSNFNFKSNIQTLAKQWNKLKNLSCNVDPDFKRESEKKSEQRNCIAQNFSWTLFANSLTTKEK